MKKHFSYGFTVLALLLISGMVMLGACDNPTQPDKPKVTSVTVSAANDATSVQKGATLQLSAVVAGTNNPAQTVTWSITTAGVNAGTTVSGAGLLTVAAAETQASVTVRATSTVNVSKYGEITIELTDAPPQPPTVTSVTVTTAGGVTSVQKGTSLQLSAVVAGTNNPAQTVTWSITTAGVNAGTTVSSAGLLTVAAAETQASITVRATSNVDTTKNGEVPLTVTDTPVQPPTVTGVTVSAANNATSVQKGATLQFSAVVAGTNNPAQTVTWSITTAGVNAGTTINSSTGLLTVAAAETQANITVRATSNVDTTKNGEKAVTVTNPPPTVTSVTVSSAGNAVSVTKGGTLQFSAAVVGTNNPAQTVTWSISSTGHNAGTTISATGLLTVAAAETQASITVRATSNVDTTKNGEKQVSVIAPDVPSVTGITVSSAGNATTIEKGQTLQFSANVTVTNGAAQTVTWSISSTGHNAGTTISATGLLTVNAAESQSSITVKAASTVTGFTNVYGEKTIAIKIDATNLGAFTWSNPDNVDNQKAWGFGGFNGNLPWADFASAKYLIIETKGSGNRDGFGGMGIVLQGEGNSYAWTQSDVLPNWTAFPNAATDTVYLVVKLDTLGDYAAFKGGTKGILLLGMWPLSGLGLQNAYLTDAELTKPAGAVDMVNSQKTYGFITKDLTLGQIFNYVNIGAFTGGLVTAAPAKAKSGTEITLTVTPNNDYVLTSLTVTGPAGAITVTNSKFTMPVGAVTVTATFKIPGMIEDFTKPAWGTGWGPAGAAAASGVWSDDGGWYTGYGARVPANVGRLSGQLTGAPGPSRAYGIRQTTQNTPYAFDLAAFNKITFGVYVQENGDSAPYTMKFQLETSNPTTTYTSPDFVIYPDEIYSWQDFELALDNFTDGSGNKFTDATNKTVTGWAIYTTGGLDLFISEIRAKTGAAASRPIKQVIQVVINVEADFAGLPRNIILVGDQVMELSLTNYSTARWYIDGILDASATDGTYSLKAAVLGEGSHSLTVVVTVNGRSYSKKIDFTVKG